MKRSCARCGATIDPGKHVYSKYTKSYYCWDLDECDKRAKKAERKQQKKPSTYEENQESTADELRGEIEKHGLA